MFTLLTSRFRRTRTGSAARPQRRVAVTALDPYADRRRAMQRVQAAELAELGELDEPEPRR